VIVENYKEKEYSISENEQSINKLIHEAGGKKTFL